jgi:hypothetical protein
MVRDTAKYVPSTGPAKHALNSYIIKTRKFSANSRHLTVICP